MKKLFFLLLSVSVLTSCDFMLKKRDKEGTEVKADKRVMLGNDKDDNGCVLSAGYRWSVIRDECTRVFEEGYRLNSINNIKEEDGYDSAFIIFEENGNKAELFLPDSPKSILLQREKEGKPYIYQGWKLLQDKGYTLSKNGEILYAAAGIEENQVIGSDQPEEQ